MRPPGPPPGPPLGGDWASGERVFGPPTGTLDADWLVPVVREAVPGVDHAAARAAVTAVWSVLREEAAARGCAPADVPEGALRARLGLPGDLPGGSGGLSGGSGAARTTAAAVVAVRAAVRAYDAS